MATVTMGHPVLDTVLAELQKQGAEYSTVDAQLQAVEGNRDDAVKAYIESGTDTKLVALRDKYEALYAQMTKLAEESLAKTELSEEEKSDLKKRHDALRASFRDGIIAIRKTGELLGVDSEKVDKALAEVGNPTSSGRGRPLGAKGASGPRASVTVTVKGDNGNFEFDGFSKAAAKFNGDTADFQKAYATAAGVELNDISSVKEPQDFTVQIGDKSYQVHTEPKARAARGSSDADSKPASDSTESAEQTNAA